MSDKILKLDQAQTLYQDLRGRIDALPTSSDIPEVPVQDVQINGASILSQGVANVPLATSTVPGVIIRGDGFWFNPSNNKTYINFADEGQIKEGTSTTALAAVARQFRSVFYGLAKAAGDTTQSDSSNAVGTYTDAAKQKIQNMFGITDLLSTEETTTATAAHALNSLFLMGGKLYKATVAIAIGDAVVEGTNCQVVKADEVFVKNTDYASKTGAGIVKVNRDNTAIEIKDDGRLATVGASEANIKNGAVDSRILTPYNASYAVFYGLSKSAGVDLKDETVTYGTYPETSKTAIRSLIGAAAASDVTVSDVQVNGTSILSQGIANIPLASTDNLGVVKTNENYGTQIAYGNLALVGASGSDIQAGTNGYKILAPKTQHTATFYGLAKAAGVDMASYSSAVGTYPETAKTAIRNMLGAASPDVVAIQDEQPTNTDTKVWLPETQAAGVEVPTYAEFQALDAAAVKDVQINGTSVLSNGVANVPVATNSGYHGIVKVNPSAFGIAANAEGTLYISGASSSHIKAGTNGYKPITPDVQHESTFYGLAKAAGDTTQSASDNAVGTYTADASAAIRNMLGAVGDVQVNGTSIISNGIANVPIASSSALGVVSPTGALYINSNNKLAIDTGGDTQFKAGAALSAVITPNSQHKSTFYGLAKAAGDTTQSASSNAVGTYTTEAKSAIQSMLGIDLQSIASEVEIPLVETITGTTPSITGQPNTRYVCGEVSTLSITPPSAGSIDVIFDSGSTPAVITVPNTVRWPVWFDATTLEADTTYEILITDGVYGSVMTWAN